MDLDLSSSEFEITGINPVYNQSHEKGSDGFFEVYFSNLSDKPFHLSFASVIASMVHKDSKLFEYLQKSGFTTTSEAIADLYDLGFPVEDEVRLHMEKVKASVDVGLLQKMFELMMFLKRFDARDQKGYDEDKNETT